MQILVKTLPPARIKFRRPQEMSHVMMPVVIKNDGAREFALRGLNGWTVDDFSTVVSCATP